MTGYGEFLWHPAEGEIVINGYSQRAPTLPRNHAPSCIYTELLGEFQGLFIIYLFIYFFYVYSMTICACTPVPRV